MPGGRADVVLRQPFHGWYQGIGHHGPAQAPAGHAGNLEKLLMTMAPKLARMVGAGRPAASGIAEVQVDLVHDAPRIVPARHSQMAASSAGGTEVPVEAGGVAIIRPLRRSSGVARRPRSS